ncbi:anaerobic sulfatase maturase [Vibrio renipiscarius]|uniref:anaerobic sulfatase maturase n=1 Tax=Vibrio renipiscarius TaxID=1461322 RepID=UPI00354B416E
MASTQLPFSLFFKPLGSQCNLDCRYCYYWNKHDATHQAHIDHKLLDRAIDQHIAAQPVSDRPIDFIWHGGEPLLAGLAFYQSVVERQSHFISTLPHKPLVKNTIQTNGSLISQQWAKFFADHHFMVGISIDGPEHIHDLCRVDKKGNSTFSRTLRGIDHLRRNGVEFNTLSVINNQNYHCGQEIYQFLKQNGSGYMQFQPCLDHELDQRDERNWSLTGEQWGAFLCAVFDQWCANDVGKVYVQFFENCLMILMGYPSQICHHSAECGQQLAIEKDGAIYSCDHYVYPDYQLGKLGEDVSEDASLQSLANSQTQRRFGADKQKTLSQQCQQCDFLPLCQGGCPKYRLVPHPGDEQHNALCAGYQRFFYHALPTLIPMVTAMKNGYSAEYYSLFR